MKRSILLFLLFSLGMPVMAAREKETTHTVTTTKTTTHKTAQPETKPSSHAAPHKTGNKPSHVTTNLVVATPADNPPLKASVEAMNNAINTNFSHWVGQSKSGTSNNELTSTDIETQLKNENLKGQNAATLAAIAVRVNGMTVWDAQSIESVNQKLAKFGLENAFGNGPYTTDTSKSWEDVTVTLIPVKDSNPQTYTTRVTFTLKQLQNAINAKDSSLYDRYKETLNNLRASFYTDGRLNLYGGTRTNLPAVAEIRQGPEGDCYFISSIEALLNSNPTALQNMIKHVSDNTYEVTFPGQAPIQVTPTHAEVAMFSYVEGGGGWLAILAVASEKALKNNNNFINLLHGGTPSQVLSLITGQTYQALPLSTLSDKQVNHMLTQAFVSQPVTPVGIEVSNHALSITNYNPQTGMVTIQNPWGTNGKYVTPNGTTLTMTNQGQITVPVAQLVADGFIHITVPDNLNVNSESKLVRLMNDRKNKNDH